MSATDPDNTDTMTVDTQTPASLLEAARDQVRQAEHALGPRRASHEDLARVYTTLADLLDHSPGAAGDISQAARLLRKADSEVDRFHIATADDLIALARVQVRIARVAGTVAHRHPSGSTLAA